MEVTTWTQLGIHDKRERLNNSPFDVPDLLRRQLLFFLMCSRSGTLSGP